MAALRTQGTLQPHLKSPTAPASAAANLARVSLMCRKPYSSSIGPAGSGGGSDKSRIPNSEVCHKKKKNQNFSTKESLDLLVSSYVTFLA